MSFVDKAVFESRGALGCSDSEYAFSMTTCCERVGIVDHELHRFYWDAQSTDRSVSLFEEPPCPFCDASAWGLQPLEGLEQVPEAWRWTCTSQGRARGRVQPLAEHVRASQATFDDSRALLATYTFTGGCHCGNLSYVLESRSGDLALRACDCSFCRLHGTIGAAPLDGRLRVRVAEPPRLQRYRFGSRSADVLLCTQCGVSIGVVTEIEGSSYAVVNARTLAGVALPDSLPRLSVNEESALARAERRRANWIPNVEITEDASFG